MSDLPLVFVAYSHEDKEWKKTLLKYLRVLHREDTLAYWTDDDIPAGTPQFEESIDEAIRRATLAIVLVSVDSLDSDFIREFEMPRLLDRMKGEGLPVIFLIVRPCPWRAVPWIAGSEVRPKEGSLSGLGDHELEQQLTEFVMEVALILGDLVAGEGRRERPVRAEVQPAGLPLRYQRAGRPDEARLGPGSRLGSRSAVAKGRGTTRPDFWQSRVREPDTGPPAISLPPFPYRTPDDG